MARHILTGFESPSIAEYDPVARGRLPADFSGSAYDAVLLGDSPGKESGLDWLRDLSRRNGFPPVIYLVARLSPESREAAIAAGAHACLAKGKLDHEALIAALRAAQARRGQFSRPAARSNRRATRVSARRRFAASATSASWPTARYPASTSPKASEPATRSRSRCCTSRPTSGSGVRNFDRFLREYQIAAGIDHPNVAHVQDFGVADDHAFIAMEYFPLGDLRGRIKQGIPPLRSLTFLRQMAEALQVLHRAGVLHRDLKPGNVMLRDELSVALIDYGLSKHVEMDATLTNSGEIFGTPYYMSPEQGHGRDTDARSDIYSIGIIFYEMLMRRKPYVAGTPMQVIYKHAHSPLPELKAELKRFEGLLYNCIAKDPKRRYGSADQLLDEAAELERDELER